MSDLIEVESLSKRFGAIVAVDDVSFSVARGVVMGFLGPNGAGKSTTMRVITGYLPPTSGTARVLGHDIQKEPVEVKRRIGFLPEGAPLYGDMTVYSFLEFIAAIRQLHGPKRRQRILYSIERMGLEQVLYQRVETLSKGFKRRVGFAQAILHDPDVLILDEPTDGLDPNQKHHVRELIRELGKDKAIIISTHILEEVDAVCDLAVIIDRGRVVSNGTPAELHARSKFHNSVVLRVRTDAAPKAAKILRAITHVASVDTGAPQGGHVSLSVVPRDGRFIADEVGIAVRQNGIEVDEMHTESGKLDEVFRQMTVDREQILVARR
ncbi:MAG: ABC transporter ATP-binding protein [Alphaproteobacteria bacterium]|nr:ABC transporter ATP-binding protein [Alphaproteobacteria bacterium]